MPEAWEEALNKLGKDLGNQVADLLNDRKRLDAVEKDVKELKKAPVSTVSGVAVASSGKGMTEIAAVKEEKGFWAQFFELE